MITLIKNPLSIGTLLKLKKNNTSGYLWYNISVFYVLVKRKMWPNLLNFGILVSSNVETTEKTHFNKIESF